ncbi:hypothetical protein F5Y18DRAFT_30918 [Xylariaceae sp. FL1019]|nr:hypothetical protein F5Y18DRAFT_30918 [Xylariaceae sp. FL1019]
MEHTLHCNVLKCRKELGDRALVTTCYHIFCADCVNRLGLASQRPTPCPACGAHLANPDDAVVANLKPSEDYKTSVLSGLSPNTIMDCASRALSFWAYQVTQEIIYQQHMSRTLTQKYSRLNVDLDKVVNDANAEIANCHNKLKNAEFERDETRKRYDELLQTYKEKNKRLLQTQELYDKLKRRAMLDQVQDAAEDAVESTLHIPPNATNTEILGSQDQPYFQSHGGFYGPSDPIRHEQHTRPGLYGKSQSRAIPHASNWPRTMGAQSDVPLTPSTHRQRIGESAGIGLSNIPGLVVGTSRSPRNQTSSRTPMGALSSNHLRHINNSFPAATMSSGLKIGQNVDGHTVASKPRAIQRPSVVSAYHGNSTIS